MALSRIWTAFVIVASLVALGKFMFNPDDSKIFSMMITGKSGDSLVVRNSINSGELSKQELIKLDETPEGIKKNGIVYKKNQDKVEVIKVQQSSGIIDIAKVSVDICIGLIGIMALFMGLMSIAEKAGGINFLSRMIYPFFSKLFPEIPKGHASMGHMMMNFSANLLGLDNAATPFGLKAMESLQELNPNKNVASNSQIMFMCLHASGLTLVPISIIGYRASYNAENPTDVFIPCMLATFVSTLTALIFVSIRQKINLFQPVVLAWLGGSVLLVVGFVSFLMSLDSETLKNFSENLGNGLILLIFFVIVLGALYKKIDIFGAFIDGAKEGFGVSIKIIPYLVGILVAISLLRTSGTFEFVMDGLRHLFSFFPDTRFVDGLPTALIKPLSGSGARGMMFDAMDTFGVDSFQGRLAGVMQGSTDTTFYVLAVYFGSVAIRNTRYSISAMLLADLMGIIASILLAYLFFG
ncbi:MAG: spore maturation protein [Flavobacteriales bacterium]|nr:spore maturation protein [Flavobacteriales bacterium]